jgi:hypothetical protein
MERKNDPKTLRHDSKEEIVDKAKKGVFDSNPFFWLLRMCWCAKFVDTNSARITCLSYLKSGRFELGRDKNGGSCPRGSNHIWVEAHYGEIYAHNITN